MNTSNLETLNLHLTYLKEKFGVADDIKIVPSSIEEGVKIGKRGRVEGSTIYLYEDDLGRAMETLDHEFIEYVMLPYTEESFRVHNSDVRMLKAFFQPYEELTDKMLYDSKEKVIESLRKGFLGLEKSNRDHIKSV